MKKVYMLLLKTIVLASACILSHPLKIHQSNEYMSTQGYQYGPDIKKNGEYVTLKHILFNHDIVFDVGANVGEWSQDILSINNSVILYSFEPIPTIFSDLTNNLANKKNVHLYNFAFSNESNVKTFFYYEKLSTLSGLYHRSLVDSLIQSNPTQLLIPTRTIDSFCIENAINYINLLKIDTEGAEYDVLIGAKNMLQQNNIGIVQFEYGGTYQDSDTTLKQVYKSLTQYNYSIYRIINTVLIAITEWQDFLENYMYSNFLAVSPQELHRIT